jgi:hypothetical protein
MSPVASNIERSLSSANGKMPRPIRAQSVKKFVGGKHVIIGDGRLSGKPLAIFFGPFRGSFGSHSFLRNSGSHNSDSQRTSTTGASHAHHQHSRLLANELDPIRGERVGTMSATLLLEVFLNSAETSTIQTAHKRPSILGSTRCAEHLLPPPRMHFFQSSFISSKGLYLNVVRGQVIPQKKWLNRRSSDGAY